MDDLQQQGWPPQELMAFKAKKPPGTGSQEVFELVGDTWFEHVTPAV